MRELGLPIRPKGSIRGALVAVFAVVFALWVIAGYGLVRNMSEVTTTQSTQLPRYP